MNCELFSIRGDQQEINRLNENLGAIASGLSKLDMQILFKTEVDRSTSKIEDAIIESVNDQSSPEVIIIANALDKKLGADFISVFSKIIYNWETRCRNSLPIGDREKAFHVKIYPIEDLGFGNNGYCFTIYNTRVIVLPCETAVQKPIDQLICQGVQTALDKFSEGSSLYPDGLDFSENQEDIWAIERYDREAEEKAAYEAQKAKEEAENAAYGYGGSQDFGANEDPDGVYTGAYSIPGQKTESRLTAEGDYSAAAETAAFGFSASDAGSFTAPDYSQSGGNAAYPQENSFGANGGASDSYQTSQLQKEWQTENIEYVSGPLSKKEAKKLEKTRRKQEKREAKRLTKAERKQEKREAKKNKKGFFRRNFPCRGDKPLEVARKSIIIVAFITIVVCVSMIVNEMVILPAQNEKLQSEIQNIFYNSPQPTRPSGSDEDKNSEEDNTEPQETSEYNWEALKEINSEIIGWISIDNTIIDYPVLCHEDDPPGTTDPYYLHHNYANQWDSYGAIFTDPTSFTGLDTQNIAIHGHHMNNGSMFGNLVYYGTGFADGNGTPYVNLDFYKSSPIIHFNTPEWNADWKIIAVIHTNALESHGEFFNYLQGNFNSDEEFLDFVYNVRERSIIDTDVDVNENDQLITLSTCTYEFENFRTAVIARRVRPGEDSSVNVDNASVNTDMVWPDVYYWTFGGTKPELKTFAQAYADGDISWYDGELFD